MTTHTTADVTMETQAQEIQALRRMVRELCEALDAAKERITAQDRERERFYRAEHYAPTAQAVIEKHFGGGSL